MDEKTETTTENVCLHIGCSHCCNVITVKTVEEYFEHLAECNAKDGHL